MIILSYIFSVFAILQILQIIIYVSFRFVCSFRKSCKWKKCPFRNKCIPTDVLNFGDDFCVKCPYPFDEEERQQMLQEIKYYKSIIGIYEKENSEEPKQKE